MPNGNDRNWIRFCAAVDGFRSVFGRWPVRVRLFPDALADIRDHILRPEDFARVRSQAEFGSAWRPFVDELDTRPDRPSE